MASVRLGTNFLLMIAVAGCWLASGEDCHAQVARYQPQAPTLSPFLNLTRFNTGGLPNYHALVRPQIQQRQFNLQEQALLQQQGRHLLQLQNDMQRGLVGPAQTGTGSWFMIPGSRSTFLNSSQFFPEPAAGGGRR